MMVLAWTTVPGRAQPKGEGPGVGGEGVLGTTAYGDLPRAGVKKGGGQSSAGYGISDCGGLTAHLSSIQEGFGQLCKVSRLLVLRRGLDQG